MIPTVEILKSTTRIAHPPTVSTWSTSPSSEAILRNDGAWEDVVETTVKFKLKNEGYVIISYELPVTATKTFSDTANNFFTATQTTAARGTNNFVQVKIFLMWKACM